MDLSNDLETLQDQRAKYIEYALIEDGHVISSGTTLFVRPKAFLFQTAHIQTKVFDCGKSFSITMKANCFVKSVFLSLMDYNCIFSENWFDIHGGQAILIQAQKNDQITHLSEAEFEHQLNVANY